MGIMCLPKDFEAKLGRGEESVFVTYNTTLSFLIYEAMMEASSGAMLELDGSLRPDQVVFLNADVVQPVTNTRSIQVQGFALYNESGGYATYLIPSVLMVIIFQTMLIVISMLCGKENEQRMKPLLDVTHHESSWGMRKIGDLCGILCPLLYFFSGFSPIIIQFASFGKAIIASANTGSLHVCNSILWTIL